MQRSLTEGSIPVGLFKFALPILFANILQSLNGSVNAIWVGRFLGEAALTATSNANTVMFLLIATAFGVALAAFAGVLAAPVIQVSPLMGQPMIITVFAVVVIGGMGSIMGSILTGLMLGVIEGFTRVFWPEASATVVFVIMAIVLLIRPAGLFGKER